ncbi:hypothetical protein LCGC14_2823730 [marine sediment metagenome]|uniref:Uncharacterized protein n=1 Tax=marine sediment metagenome TaxID=412755 RepID=A0A0F8YG23_9ZZZZ
MPHTNDAEPEDFIDDIALAALGRRRRRREALERGDLGQQGSLTEQRLREALARRQGKQRTSQEPLP